MAKYGAIITDRSKEVLALIERSTEEDIQYLGEVMVVNAQEIAPRLTGNLVRSISMRLEGKILRVLTECGYGAYVELGTTKMAAQPYLAPSWKIALDKLKARISGRAGK